MKTYKLMVKQHTTTGLKYLCITSRKNWLSYTGSGRHWRNHLQKHSAFKRWHFDNCSKKALV